MFWVKMRSKMVNNDMEAFNYKYCYRIEISKEITNEHLGMRCSRWEL